MLRLHTEASVDRSIIKEFRPWKPPPLRGRCCQTHVTFSSEYIKLDSLRMTSEPRSIRDDDIAVSLTHSPLDIMEVISEVKSPKAGAIVLFAGCLFNFGSSSLF